jgi:hypothetical protein
MDLKAATEQDIQNELKRREMIRRDTRIKDLIDEIILAYNSGRIDHINTDTANKGTSVEVRSFHIFLK